MLILSRKVNECIVIDGRIVVKIVRLEGDIVKVGIEAPQDVPIHRQEVYLEIQKNNQEALTQGRPSVPKLPSVSRNDPPRPPRPSEPKEGTQSSSFGCMNPQDLTPNSPIN